jgi:2-alkyl-3-oxoalkanoate reductase
MKVLVTGAGGFLGRAVVDALLSRGHEVLAMVRPATSSVPSFPTAVATVRGDLRQRGAWESEVQKADAVVHLAAAASGSLSEQFAGTVLATENLLAACRGSRVSRFVHVSSFSVYDFTSPPTGGALDEATPLESHPERRDAYTSTKLVQERLVVETCSATDIELVVARPGAVFGPGKEWDHGAALHVGSVALVFAPRSQMRLTYVTNCADALAAAVTAEGAPGRTLNVVDDDLPTHAEFFSACHDAGLTRKRALGVPWPMVATIGTTFDLIDRTAFGRRARLPELVARRRQMARWRPLLYPNDAVKCAVGWAPRVHWRDGVDMIAAGRRA